MLGTLERKGCSLLKTHFHNIHTPQSITSSLSFSLPHPPAPKVGMTNAEPHPSACILGGRGMLQLKDLMLTQPAETQFC